MILKADTNFTGERNAKITVTGDGVEPFIVDVKQTVGITVGNPAAFYNLDKMPFTPENFSINIDNDLSQLITISSSEPWLTLSNRGWSTGAAVLTSNNSNFNLYIFTAENAGSANRTATVTIKNKGGEVVKTLTITQVFDTFTGLFTGVNWQLKRATEYTSLVTFVNQTIKDCIGDNRTKFTKSTTSSGGNYVRDNGIPNLECDEFGPISTGSYSSSSSSGYTSLYSNFNSNFDNESSFYVEKITSDSLKLRSSTSSNDYTRYEFLKVQ